MARGLAGVIYGLEGLGKTSLGLRFPGPVWCKSIKETGYDDLMDGNVVPSNSMNSRITSWEQLVQECRKVTNGTLLLDGCTGIQHYLCDFVCRNYYASDWGKFNNYSMGIRKESVMVFQEFLDLCTDLAYKGVNVIFLGHQGTVTMTNAMGVDPVCHVIKMDDGDKGGLRSSLTAWASFVFFLNNDIRIGQATNIDHRTKQALEGKALDGDKRVILTTNSVFHQAKNRWNMPAAIPMGRNADEAFANLWKHIPPSFKKEPATKPS